MTLDSIKDVVAVLGALVGLITAVATGVAKLCSWYKGRKAPAPETAAIPSELSPIPLASCSATPLAGENRPLPQTISTVPAPALEQARAAVKAPALCIMALGGAGFLFNVLLACFGFVDNFVTPLSSSSILIASPADQKASTSHGGNATSDQASTVLTIVLLLCMSAATLAAFFGGLSMLKLQNHLMAAAGSIAIMPGTCFCCMLGFPVGAWSIIVLMRPEVRAAFHS